MSSEVPPLAGNFGICDPAISDAVVAERIRQRVSQIERCQVRVWIAEGGRLRAVSVISMGAASRLNPSELNRDQPDLMRVVHAVLGSDQSEDLTALREALRRYEISFEMAFRSRGCVHVKLAPIVSPMGDGLPN